MEETQEGHVQGLPVQLESLVFLAPWGSSLALCTCYSGAPTKT